MKARILLLVASAVLMTAMALPAYSQNWRQNHAWGWQDRDGDHDRDWNNNQRAYDEGYREGQRDRGKRWHPDAGHWKGDDIRAYQAGYKAGYSQADRDHDRVHGRSPAEKNGYEDGFLAGQGDRDRRIGFKPTGSNIFKHADHGYIRAYGDKNEYRREFREAYQLGYADGYNRRGRR
jgi:hypothetical protein